MGCLADVFSIEKSMENAGVSAFLGKKKIDFFFFFFLSIDLAFPWQEPPAVPAAFKCSPCS